MSVLLMQSVSQNFLAPCILIDVHARHSILLRSFSDVDASSALENWSCQLNFVEAHSHNIHLRLEGRGAEPAYTLHMMCSCPTRPRPFQESYLDQHGLFTLEGQRMNCVLCHTSHVFVRQVRC